MKSRELVVNYGIECETQKNKSFTNDDLSNSVNKLFEILLQFSMSMGFLKGSDKESSINWFINHFERISSASTYRTSEDPLEVAKDLLLHDINWYVSGLSSSGEKVFINFSLVIKNNKKLEVELSSDYFKKIIPLVEVFINNGSPCKIKLKPTKVDIDAELIQKEKRVVRLCNNIQSSNENNI